MTRCGATSYLTWWHCPLSFCRSSSIVPIDLLWDTGKGIYHHCMRWSPVDVNHFSNFQGHRIADWSETFSAVLKQYTCLFFMVYTCFDVLTFCHEVRNSRRCKLWSIISCEFPCKNRSYECHDNVCCRSNTVVAKVKGILYVLNILKQLFILHLTSLVNLRIVVFIKVKIKLKSRL